MHVSHAATDRAPTRACRHVHPVRRIVRRATAALARHAVVALALLIPPAAGRAQLPEGAARRARAALDSIADATVARGRAAGLVGVVVRGADTLVARAYGRADVENDVPLTLGHVFQLASITKQFTAAAVLALVDSGVVALDAPITRYLPDAPVRGQPMTVRQLLGHTSGLPDFAESPRGRAIGRLDVPPDTVLALVRDTPLYFAPGALMRYSNTGFVLLGQLIERASGRPYAAYVEERVLRRAGATGARFCDPEALVPRIARGYALGASGLRPAVFVSPRVPWAAGGFCGTAADLVAWNAGVHAARGGRVLTSASYAELTRAGTVAGGRRTRYGLGVSLVEVAGRRAFQHGGDIAGFTTFTAYLPDDSLSVTVLVNTQGPTRPDVVAAALVHAALGAPHASRTAHASTPRDLAPFTGRFGGDAVFSAVTDGADAPALRLARGPLPPVLLRFAGRDADGWTFTDGRARYTFEPATDAAGSRTLWADLGVALVRWERAR
jgi:CubicO group peptidase (beta-lactamase class C family)